MPDLSQTQAILLCEDDRHYSFGLAAMDEFGIDKRKLRLRKSPGGKGSAYTWVLKNFPIELQEYRKRSNFQNLSLFVIIDEDGQSVDLRRRQLAQTVAENGLAPVGDDERVYVFVPTRNIETWAVWCRGDQVDEYVDYSKKPIENVAPLAREFARSCRQGSQRPRMPKSLQAACTEFLKSLQ